MTVKATYRGENVACKLTYRAKDKTEEDIYTIEVPADSLKSEDYNEELTDPISYMINGVQPQKVGKREVMINGQGQTVFCVEAIL